MENMNEELEKQLSEKYPILYRYTNEESIPMAFGFECGDGWYDLIDELSEKIEQYNRKEIHQNFIQRVRHWISRKIKWLWWVDIKEKYPVTALQIKEKFGGLRFYIGGAPKYIHDLISKAEADSYTICEWCGSKKNTETKASSGHYWIRTLCSVCRKKEEKRRRK